MFGRSRKEKAKSLIDAVCSGRQLIALDLLTDDFTFIDSQNFEVSGKPAFTQYLAEFCSLNLCLQIDYGELGVSGDQILMSGDQTSRHPELNARVQWQISFRGNKICSVRTFRGKGAPSILRVMHEAMEEKGQPVVSEPVMFRAA